MTKSARCILAIVAALALIGGGCATETGQESEPATGTVLALPEVSPVDLVGAPLRVVATTSIVGDVVAHVGGSHIELTTLMGPGQDPHGYDPTPRDMAAVSQAHVLFVNGWDLEEALVHDLDEIGEDAPFVPISAGIEPIEFGGHEEDSEPDGNAHEHGAADPHVWFSIENVKQWANNADQALAALDPAHAEEYHRNAEVYLAELAALDAYARAQMGAIPEDRRSLVTNHRSLEYLARDYGLEIVGTVVPAASTMAEPSAGDLARLVETMEKLGICSLFADATVSAKLAQTVASELDGCADVRVHTLYTGAIGPAGSGADSYIGMYRHNVDAIVDGLR